MPIPQHFIDELLARVDIVDVIARHMQIKKAGANFQGLCPFHSEKTPSFSVSPSKQFFHCFGCGKSGDAIAFLREHTGVSFREAVQELAQQCGIPVPEDARSAHERQRAAAQRQLRDTLAGVLARAARAWQQQLKSAPRAIAYLKGRGLTGCMARDFGIGWAPEGWHALASVFPDYSTSALLLQAGLVAEKDGRRYDRFRARITFPIRSIKGEVIAFGARTLGDEKPKYLNSPETPLFHKGRELYGLFEARSAIQQAGWALVTEGYMDTIALAQFGLTNTVATLGTACTDEHLRRLRRFASRIVFAFDGDAAGRRAAHRALEAALPLASDTCSFHFLFLPPEHDPDSFIRAEGADALRRAAQEALPLSRFVLEAASEGCDMHSAEGRAHFAANARPLWQALPTDGVLRQQLLADVAAAARLDAPTLLHTWAAAAAPALAWQRATLRQHPARAPLPPLTTTVARMAHTPMPQGLDAHARSAAHLLLHHAALWDSLGEDTHTLLASIQSPWGEALRWLEQQSIENGAQAASVLLHAAPPASALHSLASRSPPAPASAAHDLQRCLLHIQHAFAQQHENALLHSQPGSAAYAEAVRHTAQLKKQLDKTASAHT